MKRWAALTIGLYAVSLALVGSPLWLLLSKDSEQKWFAETGSYMGASFVVTQAVLLLIPLAAAQERPVKRRKIAISVAIGAVPMALLTMLFCYSLVSLVVREGIANGALDWWAYELAALWLLWGAAFWRSYASANPESVMASLTRWLLRGSILELVVAVPSHIVARGRNECCAPLITLLGISTGLAVALLSFGPGLFFLFAKRMREKRRAAG